MRYRRQLAHFRQISTVKTPVQHPRWLNFNAGAHVDRSQSSWLGMAGLRPVRCGPGKGPRANANGREISRLSGDVPIARKLSSVNRSGAAGAIRPTLFMHTFAYFRLNSDPSNARISAAVTAASVGSSNDKPTADPSSKVLQMFKVWFWNVSATRIRSRHSLAWPRSPQRS